MKKVVSLLLVSIMLVVALTSCGNKAAEEAPKAAETTAAAAKAETEAAKEEAKAEEAAPAAEKKIKAVCILQDSGGAAWGACKDSFIRGAEAHGWDYEFMSPVTVNSTPEMITLAENVVSQGDADILITAAIDGEMWSDVLLRARKAGMIVIGIVRPPSIDGLEGIEQKDLVNAAVGFEVSKLAEVQAAAMDQIVPKDTKIVGAMFHQLVADTTQDNWDFLVAEMAKLRPDAELIAFEADDNNPAIAADKIASLKLAHPELNCIFGQDMGTAMGIHNYVSERGLQDEMYTIGVDASNENLGAVKSGTVDVLIEQGYARFGEDACNVAAQILNGEDFNFYDTGTMTVITPDNVDDVAKELGLTVAEL